MPCLSSMLSIGTLMCSVGCAAAAIINFVRGLPAQFSSSIKIAFWVSTIDILLLCFLLALGSAYSSEKLNLYFGFLQYSAGSGMLLIFIGSLVLGIAGELGEICGATAMGWGAFSIMIHCATSGADVRGAPRNEPLLPAAPDSPTEI